MPRGRARALAAGAVLALVAAVRAIVFLHRVATDDIFAFAAATDAAIVRGDEWVAPEETDSEMSIAETAVQAQRNFSGLKWLGSQLLEGEWTLDDIRRRYRIPLDLQIQNFDSLPTMSAVTWAGDKPSAKNRTRGSRLLVYNRVPKCASSTMQMVMAHLMRRNDFEYVSSPVYWVKSLSVEEERAFFENVLKQAKSAAFAYDQHVYFVDGQRHGVRRRDLPTWINVVRNPVERFVSQFHYLRQPKRWEEAKEKPSQSWFDKNITDCILNDDLECRIDPASNLLVEQQLTYFCGSAVECLQVGNKAALQRAKANLESHFAVVGVVTDLELSLHVLEAYVPRFFAGAVSVFRRMAADGKEYMRNRASRSHELDARALRVLEGRLAMDIDLYNFAVRRLQLQYQQLVLRGRSLGTRG